jgi:hypothetical protein
MKNLSARNLLVGRWQKSAMMLSARAKLHNAVLAIVREDAVCRRLMTVPGVGPWWQLPSSRRWTIRAGSRSRRR